MDAIKDEIRMKIISPLEHPELYQAYGKTAGGGILMYGPPGCGKTHLARATAGEMRPASSPSASATCSTCGSAQREEPARAVRAGPLATSPCVLFFDEVDALGASRADLRHTARPPL